MIIGLSGYAQSGKDTVAQVLVDNYGFTRVAFADKIREFLYEMNPLIQVVGFEPIYLKEIVDSKGWEVAKQNPHVRVALQKAGVSARKTFGEDFWINQALKNLRHGNYVITDVRFKNEATAIWSMPGKIWRVNRPGVTAVNSHVSETQMDDYPVDHFVNNDGDIKDLWEEVLMLCHHMGFDDV